jgi:hypothetical protein
VRRAGFRDSFPDPPGKTGERLIIYIIYISHAFKTLSGKREAIS